MTEIEQQLFVALNDLQKLKDTIYNKFTSYNDSIVSLDDIMNTDKYLENKKMYLSTVTELSELINRLLNIARQYASDIPL